MFSIQIITEKSVDRILNRSYILVMNLTNYAEILSESINQQHLIRILPEIQNVLKLHKHIDSNNKFTIMPQKYLQKI